MSDKNYVPIPIPRVPQDACQPAELSGAEAEMYKGVLEHFAKPDYIIPGLEHGELSEEDKFWLSRECLLRYLRATKWSSSQKAIQRLEETLKWRRDFGVNDLVTASHVEPEAVTGKEILCGYDTHRRPAFYMIPSRQNTTEAKRQIEFAVWMLERSIETMGPGVESIDLMINFADKARNPSLSTARAVLNILQDHYPERLGIALIINVPILVHAFFKVISPFIDPVTRVKMKFNPNVIEEKIFTPDMLMKEWWGGDMDFVYEHEKYWPVLVTMCEANKKVWRDKWRALGGTVGLREWDCKSGDHSNNSTSVGTPELSEKTPVPEDTSQVAQPVIVDISA